MPAKKQSTKYQRDNESTQSDVSTQSNDDKLTVACRNANIKEIDRLLNEKVLPTEQSFAGIIQYAVESGWSIDMHEDMVQLMIKKFVYYGYVVTKQNIIDLIEYGIEIENVEKEYFDDDKFMNELTRRCNENEFFPYGVKRNVTALKNLLRQTTSLKTVKEFIKQNNIVPDDECLDIVCSHGLGSVPLIKLFVEEYKLNVKFSHLFSCLKYYNNKFEYIVKELEEKIKPLASPQST